MKKRLSAILSVCIISALLLASCGIFSSPEKEAEKSIRVAVENYFDEMQDGTFYDNGFSDSDYVHDAPFADLVFQKESAREIMGQAMTVLEYEILDASCDKDIENGECEVQLTYVDLESVIEDIGEHMTSEALLEAVLDTEAPTSETTVTLDMILDEPKWIIEDSTEIAELLGVPYTSIFFAPDAMECSQVIDLLFTALAQGDREKVGDMSPGFDSNDFFAVSPEDITLWEAFYGSVAFEITGEPQIEGDNVMVGVSLSFPNMTEISQDLAEDDEQMLAIMIEYFTYLKEYVENDAEFVSSRAIMNEIMSSAFSASKQTVEVEAEFGFLIDPENGDLIFTDIPQALVAYTVDINALEDACYEAVEPALNDLFDSGVIDLETYDYWYAIYVRPSDVLEISGDEMIAAMVSGGWFHYYPDGSGGEIVTEYDANETYWLSYHVQFDIDWAGANVYFVWLDEDQNQIGTYKGILRTSSKIGSYSFGDFSMNASASEKISVGTYYVAVVAPDNVIVWTDKVEVK